MKTKTLLLILLGIAAVAAVRVYWFVAAEGTDSFKAQFSSATIPDKLKLMLQFAPAAFGL